MSQAQPDFSPANPAATSGTPLSTSMAFVAIVPCRLVDTRGSTGETGAFGPPVMNANETRTIPVLTNTRCNIPSTAQAYSLNFTVVTTSFLGFLSAWPTGNPPNPTVSILNDFLGTAVANAAVVPAGTNGAIDVFVTASTQVVIDMNGYYVPQISLTAGSAAAPSLTFAGDSTSGLYSSGAGTVNVATGGASRLSVAANGNVGIGTATPGSKLDVAGDINMSGNFLFQGDPILRVYTQFPASSFGLGSGALLNNPNGFGNTAVGSGAMTLTTTGFGNTVVGSTAFQHNGNTNTVVGAQAGNGLGSANIAIGFQAAQAVIGGNHNIHIGSTGSAGDSGTIRIGTPLGPPFGIGPQTSFFAAGVRGVTTGNNDAIPVVIDSTGQLGTISSSRRFKEDIQDMGDATGGLMHLRPVTFRYIKPFADGSKPVQYGLIAEEVAEVYPDLIARSADGQIETVKYQVLDAMLLNEVQRQQAEIHSQNAEIRLLRERLDKLESASRPVSAAASQR